MLELNGWGLSILGSLDTQGRHSQPPRKAVLSPQMHLDAGCFVPCRLLVPCLIVVLLSIVFLGKESNKKIMNKCL